MKPGDVFKYKRNNALVKIIPGGLKQNGRLTHVQVQFIADENQIMLVPPSSLIRIPNKVKNVPENI